MSLREHGLERYRRLIARNIEQARYLGERIAAEPELELVTPVALNIVCYRYRFAGLSPEEQNARNRELLMQLHEQGIAAPSYTLLNGRYVIRVNITNHRTRRADLVTLVAGSLRIGQSLARAGLGEG